MLHTSDRLGLARFVTMQNHWNLVYREEEREMNPLCRDEGLGLLPWSPLARGFLAGNRKVKGAGDTSRAKTDDFAHKLYYQDADFAVVDRVTEVAGKRGAERAGGAGVVASAAQRNGADCGCVEAAPPRRRDRCARRETRTRRTQSARGAVPAARDPRTLVTRVLLCREACCCSVYRPHPPKLFKFAKHGKVGVELSDLNTNCGGRAHIDCPGRFPVRGFRYS
jgi:hypothetical protein